MVEFDERDEAIRRAREAARVALSQQELPLVGDVIELRDGAILRVAHVHDDGAQPSTRGGGSLYLGESGYMSFSGGLDYRVPFSQLVRSGVAEAPVWFFHHGHSGAHRGVHCSVTVTRWTLKDDPTQPTLPAHEYPGARVDTIPGSGGGIKPPALYLSSFDKPVGMGYHYTITINAGPWTAKQTRAELMAWLTATGLKPSEEIPAEGVSGSLLLTGRYRIVSHRSLESFEAERVRAAGEFGDWNNGDFDLWFYTVDSDGIHSLHCCLPAVKGRIAWKR